MLIKFTTTGRNHSELSNLTKKKKKGYMDILTYFFQFSNRNKSTLGARSREKRDKCQEMNDGSTL